MSCVFPASGKLCGRKSLFSKFHFMTSLARRTAGGALGLSAFLLVTGVAQAQGSFGASPVGTAVSQTVTVTASQAGTVSSVRVLTAGASGLDFTASGGGTCTAGLNLAVGGQCTQPVTFTPQYPGARAGAVVLLDSANNVLGTAFVSGTGQGGLGLLIPSAAQSGAASPNTTAANVGVAQTLAGDGKWQDSNVGDGGPASGAELFLPSAVAVDGAGNFYIADSGHNRIRLVCAGTTATIAGTSCPSANQISTVLASNGLLKTPSGVAIDGAGNLYIADTGNHQVREISAASGTITTIAGNGTAGNNGDDGPANAAELSSPFAIAVDGSGNLFIADNQANVVRAVCATAGTVLGVPCPVAGDIVTVAGTGAAGFSGDAALAVAAELDEPYAVALDASGNLFIADTLNDRIRAVCASAGSIASGYGVSCTAAGVIATVAGTGSGNFAGDGGLAAKAEVNSPSGLAFDPAGNLYIADTQNNRIRKVNATSGVIVTVAGNGGADYGGDGEPALVASIHGPYGLAFYNVTPTTSGGAQPIAKLGDLLIADFFNQRIRLLQSEVAIESYTSAVRQGFTSPVPTSNTDRTLVTVENDGNAPLNLTTLAASANVEAGTGSISGITLCANGNTLAQGTQCTVEPLFAPAATPPLSTASAAETGNIDINNDVVANVTAANSPLDIQISGTASKVNPTTVTLSSSPNPSVFGSSVKLSAQVAITSGSGTPTGNVTFFDGATQLGAPVVISTSGLASLSISSLTVGAHTITATYNGDTNDSSSTSSAVNQTVNEGTATTIVSSGSPSNLGASVTFTATVGTPAGGGVTPDGSVTFMDGSTTLGTVVLTGATAVYSTSSLPDGNNAITAVYSGDAAKYVAASTSAVLNQDVLGSSTVSVQSSGSPSIYGTAVTFTAKVTSTASVSPTGTVNFLDGTTKIGAGTIVGTSGTASFTTSSLAVGSHAITAAYLGDVNNGSGTSSPVVQVVNLAPTTTVLVAAPTPGIAGKGEILTATVKGSASGTITGKVSFTDGTVALGSANVAANGTAALNVTLAPGSHALVATYSGDSNDGGSASAPVPYTVVLATTSVALKSSGSPAVVLSPVTFTATVSGNGGVPTGTVTFQVDGATAGTGTLNASGVATFSDSKLAVGSHTVSASYGGDTDDNPSTSPSITEVETAISTTTSLGASATGGTNTQAVLVSTVIAPSGPTPTGTVTFKSGTTVIGATTLDSNGVATLVPDLAPGTYSITASYGGDSLHAPSTSAAVSISGSPAGFGIALSPPNLTLVTSQNGTISITLTSQSGFADTIGMGCLSLPAGVNCHFSSNDVALKSGQSATVQLTIDTNAPLSGGATASNLQPGRRTTVLAGLFFPLSVIFGCVFWRFRRRHAAALVMALLLFLTGAFAVTGCGGFSQSTAAPGTYTIQVGGVGTGTNLSHYQSLNLTITK
ncbi:MAG: Ig-like domain repeat protein [Acidobacteriota bacterium]